MSTICATVDFESAGTSSQKSIAKSAFFWKVLHDNYICKKFI